MSLKLVSFLYIYWLWRSSLQHSHTTVWACDLGQPATWTDQL